MINFEKIAEINKTLKTVPIEKKDKKTGKVTITHYAPVNERIKGFRQICPNGCIETDIISLENGVVTMKTCVYDEDHKLLGTGMAQEKEGSSFINQGSFIENCESSSIGRAIAAACAIGIDTSIASYEEVANAINNQGKRMIEEDNYYDALCDLMMQKGVTEEQICKRYKVANLRALSDQQYTAAAAGMQKMKDKSDENMV